MADLTSKQRAHLRGLAHHVKPTVHVGKDGVTEAAVDNLKQTFEGHELVKVRVLDAAPQSAKDTAYALAAQVPDATVVQVVGRNATLYQPAPKPPAAPAPPSPPVPDSRRRVPPRGGRRR